LNPADDPVVTTTRPAGTSMPYLGVVAEIRA
jgi:hypothetical protein